MEYKAIIQQMAEFIYIYNVSEYKVSINARNTLMKMRGFKKACQIFGYEITARFKRGSYESDIESLTIRKRGETLYHCSRITNEILISLIKYGE